MSKLDVKTLNVATYDNGVFDSNCANLREENPLYGKALTFMQLKRSARDMLKDGLQPLDLTFLALIHLLHTSQRGACVGSILRSWGATQEKLYKRLLVLFRLGYIEYASKPAEHKTAGKYYRLTNDGKRLLDEKTKSINT